MEQFRESAWFKKAGINQQEGDEAMGLRKLFGG
jgi:hypothetical protein